MLKRKIKSMPHAKTMNGNDYIIARADGLVHKYQTRNPYEIAKNLGVEVIRWDGFSRLKGMYRIIKRNRYIFINDNLDEQLCKIVCAHELGHDLLHRSLANSGIIKEIMLYDMSAKPEFEANIFAAELLIPDEDILNLIKSQNYTPEQLAHLLETDVNLISLKIYALNLKGYNFQIPAVASDFLK